MQRTIPDSSEYLHIPVGLLTLEFTNSSSCDVNVPIGLRVFGTQVKFSSVHVV